jgi:hypothetical protein
LLRNIVNQLIFLPIPTNPFLKYLDPASPLSVSEFRSNDITAILTYASYEVYEDIPIPRFKQKVHRLPSIRSTWSIYCVSPKSEDSTYLSFRIDTRNDFKYAYFGINFHYGSGKKSKFINAFIDLSSTPETCDEAFEMLLTLPEVKDDIAKANFFENI